MSRLSEYKICKVRGHKAGQGIYSYAIYNSPQFSECIYCGTTFWTTTETTQHEKNAPKSKSKERTE